MGQPDVAALLASITLAQFLAWQAYFSVEPWGLADVALQGFCKKGERPTPEQLEERAIAAYERAKTRVGGDT